MGRKKLKKRNRKECPPLAFLEFFAAIQTNTHAALKAGT